jgi:hypothetical protein
MATSYNVVMHFEPTESSTKSIDKLYGALLLSWFEQPEMILVKPVFVVQFFGTSYFVRNAICTLCNTVAKNKPTV